MMLWFKFSATINHSLFTVEKYQRTSLNETILKFSIDGSIPSSKQ